MKFSWWLAIPLMALILLSYYFFVWTPLTERVEAAAEDRRLAERELEHARSVNTRMPAMKAEIEELQTLMEELDVQILESTYQPEFLVYLQDTEAGQNIVIRNIDYGGVQVMEGVRDSILRELNYVDLAVGLEGTYQQIRDFVEEIEEGIWFTATESYDFAPLDDQPEIAGVYAFRVYFWPEVRDPAEPFLPEFPDTGQMEPIRSLTPVIVVE